jgi:hypothetical protein
MIVCALLLGESKRVCILHPERRHIRTAVPQPKGEGVFERRAIRTVYALRCYLVWG